MFSHAVTRVGTLAIFLTAVAVTACGSKSSKSSPTTASNGTSPKNKQKGSVKTGPSESKAAGQKSGSTVAENKEKATDKGAEFEATTCDEELEGTAWCGDEHTALFCSAGHWYELDCVSIGGNICAETLDAHVVDCDAPDELEEVAEEG